MTETHQFDDNLDGAASQARVIEDHVLNMIKSFISHLDKDDRTISTIEKILGIHFREKIDNTTLGAITTSFEMYMGADATNGLMSLVDRSIEEPSILEKLETEIPNKRWSDIRAFVAVFGKKIVYASTLEDENPKGWKSINRQVYFDRVIERWCIAYDIEKFNGEHACFEEEPSTLLAMAEAILDTLAYLPEDKAEELFDPVRVVDFRNACSRFLTKVGHDLAGRAESD